MPCVNRPAKRLAAGQVQHADIAQGAAEEARIEQVEHGVLDAADILIDRQPVRRLRPCRSASFDLRIGEAREVPGRIDERVHRVGFAPRLAAACRAVDVLPGRMAHQRIARRGRSRRYPAAATGRSLLRHGHDAALAQWMIGIGQPQ